MNKRIMNKKIVILLMKFFSVQGENNGIRSEGRATPEPEVKEKERSKCPKRVWTRNSLVNTSFSAFIFIYLFQNVAQSVHGFSKVLDIRRKTTKT
jgi:hypothetical protein